MSGKPFLLMERLHSLPWRFYCLRMVKERRIWFIFTQKPVEKLGLVMRKNTLKALPYLRNLKLCNFQALFRCKH